MPVSALRVCGGHGCSDFPGMVIIIIVPIKYNNETIEHTIAPLRQVPAYIARQAQYPQLKAKIAANIFISCRLERLTRFRSRRGKGSEVGGRT